MRRTTIMIVLVLALATTAPGALAKGHDDPGPPGCSGVAHWVAAAAQSGMGLFADDANLGQGWVTLLSQGDENLAAFWAEYLQLPAPTDGNWVNDFVHFMQQYGFLFVNTEDGTFMWPSGYESAPVMACAKHRPRGQH